MRLLTYHLAACLISILAVASSAEAQTEVTNAQSLASAKSVYFDDKSGSAGVGKKALLELYNWGRFQIVHNPKNADLILLLTTDPDHGGNLILSGGQTGTIDSRGRVDEDPVPIYDKLEPARYAFLIVTDARSGAKVWESSQRWGGLLTGSDSAGERLVKQFEKQIRSADQSSRLKLVKSVNPTFPSDALLKHIEGVVVLRIVVDKNGRVTSAKALSGPPEFFQASVNAAKQYQFEPPDHAPVATDVEIKYGYLDPCPPGKKGDHGTVEYPERRPTQTGHPGELKILADVYVKMPPYFDEAMEAGIEGDLDLLITVAHDGEVIGARVINSLDPALDEAALATVRTWKFKVSHGEPAGFPIKLKYRIRCSSLDQ